MYEQILYEVADPVATITLNRPAKLNAWTMRMGQEVRHAVAQAEADPRVVGIILTGAGRGFCSGGPLPERSWCSSESVWSLLMPREHAGEPSLGGW